MALTLMVASIILVLAMGMSTLAQQNLNTVANDARKSHAFYSATAGCNVALRQLRASSSYTGLSTPTSNGVTGSFTVTVTAGPGTAPDGATVPSTFKYILATGYDGTAGPGPGVPSARVGMLVPTAGVNVQPFGQQTIAGNQIGMPDAVIDSYNSSDPAEPTNRALLATNSITDGAIDLTGPRNSAAVSGSAESGVGSDPTVVISGGTFTTAPVAENAPREFPPPVVPDGLKSLSYTSIASTVNSNLTLSPGKYPRLNVAMNKTITFTPGDYYFTGDIDIAKGVILKSASVASGVRIFVDGKVTFDKDNQVNMDAGSKAGNFAILSTTSAIVQGDKDLQARFTVYAPLSPIVFHKDCQIWGAAVSDTFTGRTGAATDYTRFHYDTALQDPNSSPSVPVASAGAYTGWRRD